MKKIIFALSIVASLASCQNDVEFNNPALQTSIDNTFWKGHSFNASKDAVSGKLTIYGRGQTGDLTLTTTSANAGTYELGTTNQLNAATFLQIANNPGNYTTGINRNAAHKIALRSAGSAYTTTSSVPTIGGSGAGLKVDITANTAGAITDVKVSTSGIDYLPGDVVTITTGNQNATILIKNVSNSNGQITITENDGATISGKFSFVAFDATSKKTIASRDGVFYKIPIATK